MASGIYNLWKQYVVDNTANGRIDWDNDTIKVMLVTSSYVPNFDTHNFADDITNEVVGTGYTAGGATIAGVLITLDTVNDRVDTDATDTSWTSSTITARGAVIYKSTGTASTSPLFAYLDFGSDQISSAGTLTIQWNAAGIWRLQ